MVGQNQESFTFTVGKLDAGMAILLGERAHLIEFPSLLLPPGATAGSIVNISVQQNLAEEKRRDDEFWTLQDDILNAFGKKSPEAPKLQLRHITQTSATLEWPPLQLATAKLRSLEIYKNGVRLAAIPSPLHNTSTKLSGLEFDTDFSFQLILRTTAGTFQSNVLQVRTHTMFDTSGISVCFGNVQDPVMLENAKIALKEMRAKWSDKIQIDTTHFVCTTPATTPSGGQPSGSASGAPGVDYQRALQLSIPIVQPHWILACHAEKRMIPIAQYYLGNNPAQAPPSRPLSMSQASLPRTPTHSSNAVHRASMPAPARSVPTSTGSPTKTSGVNHSSEGQSRGSAPPFEPTPEEGEVEEQQRSQSPNKSTRRARNGTMKKDFKFPPSPPSPSTPEMPKPRQTDDDTTPVGVVAPSAVEVPPPPPVEKEKVRHEVGDEEVGENSICTQRLMTLHAEAGTKSKLITRVKCYETSVSTAQHSQGNVNS